MNRTFKTNSILALIIVLMLINNLAQASSPILRSLNSESIPLDLPLIVIPSAQQEDHLPIVLFISGDGGWTSFDRSIADNLAGKGMPVVGLDARKYFWNSKTPQECASDFSKAVQRYLQQWNRKKFILVGYSFGANVVPFIADKFSPELKESLSGIFSLSPTEKADFEIHLSDMLGIGGKNEDFNVPEEIKKIKRFRTVCIFGADEEEATRIQFGQAGATIITLPGNHHYNNHPSAAAEAIFKEIGK